MFKKIILFLLSLCLFLTACSSDDTTPPDESPESSRNTPAEPEGVEIFGNGRSDYVLVWPKKASDTVFNSFFSISEKIKSFGVDIQGNGDGETETECEILIGHTSRKESEEALSTLRETDYVIKMDGTKLVIIGGSDEATFAAAGYFIENYLRSDSLFLPEDFSEGYYKPADVAGLTLNSVNISDFRIVYPHGDMVGKRAALRLAEKLNDLTHVSLSVDDNSAASGSPEIRVVNTYGTSGSLGAGDYSISSYGKNIELKGNIYSMIYCVDSFIDMIPKKSKETVELKIPDHATPEKVVYPEYPKDESLDGRRLAALCDQKNNSLVIIDLDAEDITSKEAVVWEWEPSVALGFNKADSSYKNSIDEAILRYSKPLGTYVICVTSSSGYICVIEYPSGKCIFETTADGLGPHSAEYLPDGSLAVVCSGNDDTSKGCIRFYPFKNGKISLGFESYPLKSGHGVLWDEQLDLLWCLGKEDLIAYELRKGNLYPIEDLSVKGKFNGGHNLSVVPSDPDYLWISGSKVWLFRKSTGEVIEDYKGAEIISSSKVKSIDSFRDGTVIKATATGVYAPHNTDTLLIITTDSDGNLIESGVTFTGRAFYKARRIDARYS